MTKLSSFGSHVAANARRIQELFEKVKDCDHELCDVELRVADGDDFVVIGSNSGLLRVTSGVFNALWVSDATVRSIEIADCSAAAIGAINAVAFGCLELVEINERNIGELVYASEKYDVRLIADCCQQWLKDTIAGGDFHNALPAVASIWEHSPHLAQRYATKSDFFDSDKVTKTFESDAVTALPLSLFKDLLKSDELLLSEENVWTQCNKWAKANCENTEETDDMKSESSVQPVGDFISAMLPLKEMIRFPLMSLDFFIKEVSVSGLLTDSESLNVAQVLSGVCSDSIFCAKRRTFAMTMANACVFSRGTLDDSDNYSYDFGDFDALCITSSKKVALTGIGIWTGDFGSDVSVAIFSGDNGESSVAIHNEPSQRIVGDKRTPEPFVFAHPFVMDADQRYCVELMQENDVGDDNAKGSSFDTLDCVTEVKENGITLKIEDAYSSPSGTDTTMGSLPCFYICTHI